MRRRKGACMIVGDSGAMLAYGDAGRKGPPGRPAVPKVDREEREESAIGG
jgi:hypothetical protein